jgi:hypothetical protein
MRFIIATHLVLHPSALPCAQRHFNKIFYYKNWLHQLVWLMQPVFASHCFALWHRSGMDIAI